MLYRYALIPEHITILEKSHRIRQNRHFGIAIYACLWYHFLRDITDMNRRAIPWRKQQFLNQLITPDPVRALRLNSSAATITFTCTDPRNFQVVTGAKRPATALERLFLARALFQTRTSTCIREKILRMKSLSWSMGSMLWLKRSRRAYLLPWKRTFQLTALLKYSLTRALCLPTTLFMSTRSRATMSKAGSHRNIRVFPSRWGKPRWNHSLTALGGEQQGLSNMRKQQSSNRQPPWQLTDMRSAPVLTRTTWAKAATNSITLRRIRSIFLWVMTSTHGCRFLPACIAAPAMTSQR